MTRRWGRLVVAAAMTLVVATGLLAAAGAYGYASTMVEPGCANSSYAATTPANMTVSAAAKAPVVDLVPYRFADYADVTLHPRGGSLTLAAWYAPPARADGPVVILSHGIHACRRDPLTLLPAGMLHRAGFGVLLVDLRNHGDSAHDDGHTGLGAKESDDLLGAWDWLVARGVDPARIGMFGTSLSGSSAIEALGVEPRLAAVWSDSAFASVDGLLAEQVAQRGFPAPLSVTIIPMARVLGDRSLGTRSPDRALASSLAGRPLAIVHGAEDGLVDPHHAQDLAAAAAQGGTTVTPWIVEGAEHQWAVLVATDEYERRITSYFAGAIGTP